jgi:hypothetical protein
VHLEGDRVLRKGHGGREQQAEQCDYALHVFSFR